MDNAPTDFAILGFLMRRPMSGYDIKKLMALSTGRFYEASYGSIYPSLERMAERGLVAAERSDRPGRPRQAYAIAAAGREAFLAWLASPPDVSKGLSQLLLRVFFLGELGPERARKALEDLAQAASERRAWLGTVLDDVPEAPDYFQAATAAIGQGYYEFLERKLGGLAREAPAAAGKASIQGGKP